MGRTPRIHEPGAIFHVMSRGNGGQDVFFVDADWIEFLAILAHLKASADFRLLAYCLMPNHFHLLIQVGALEISRIMQQLLTRYSKYLNFRHDRRGHVFQGRFKAIRCSTDAYLLELVRYIHLNPVRAGIVSRPDDWSWSSHNEYAGVPRLVDAGLPLSLFDGSARERLADYLEFVQAGAIGGLDLKAPEPQKDDEPRTAASAEAALKTIAVSVCALSSIALDELRGACRSHGVSRARHGFIREATARGYRPSEIAAYLKRSPSAISKVIGSRSESQKVKV